MRRMLSFYEYKNNKSKLHFTYCTFRLRLCAKCVFERMLHLFVPLLIGKYT